MIDGFEVEVDGDATGELRQDDIKALRQAMGAEGVKFFELKIKTKSFDPVVVDAAVGIFKVVSEHADTIVPVLVAFVAGRMGRKVTVEVDGMKITAGSKKEIDALIPTLEKLAKTSKSKKKRIRP